MSAYEQPVRCIGCAWAARIDSVRCLLHDLDVTAEERAEVGAQDVAIVFEPGTAREEEQSTL